MGVQGRAGEVASDAEWLQWQNGGARDSDVLKARASALVASATELNMRNGSQFASNMMNNLAASLPAGEMIPELESYSVRGAVAPNGTLVRFTGCVQDVFDQELFVLRYGADQNRTSICSDAPIPMDDASASFDHTSAVLAERLPAYLVSVPGRTPWTMQSNTRLHPLVVPASEAASRARQKRSLESNGDGCNDDDDELSCGEPCKRPQGDSSRAPPREHDTRSSTAGNTEMQAPPSAVRSPEPLDASLGLNIPLSEEIAAKGATGVVIKLYDRELFDKMLLNRMVEMIGVVEYPDVEVASSLEPMEVGDEPQSAVQAAQSSGVPSVHVLALREVSQLDANPAMRQSGVSVATAAGELRPRAMAMKDLLVSFCTMYLGGDSLAAEYLVMCLLSKVLSRSDTIIAGKFVLNLVLPESESSTGVSFESVLQLVSNLLPRVAPIQVRIDCLNTMSLTPVRDQSGSGRLRSSRLQVPDGTLIVLDETKLASGQLNQRGVRNVQVLEQLCNEQVLGYDFVYYSMDQPVDLPVLIVSQGAKSIVRSDFCLHVRPSVSVDTSTPHDPALLDKLRLALALLRDQSSPEFHIPPEINAEVERHFVERRKEEVSNGAGGKDNAVDDLHRLLTVCRMQSRGSYNSNVTEVEWRRAVEMESERIARQRR